MENSVDQDELASAESSWSGPTFIKFIYLGKLAFNDFHIDFRR